MSDFVEESFDGVSPLVEVFVIRDEHLAMLARRNNGLPTLVLDFMSKPVAVIALVGKDGVGLQSVVQFIASGRDVLLAGDFDQADGKPKASVPAWIFVLNPPRDRPRPWASASLLSQVRPPRADGPA